MDRKLLLLILPIIPLVLVLGFLFTTKRTPAPTPAPSPTLSPSNTSNWQTITSASLRFSVSAPPDFTTHTNEDDSVGITKWGPTQAEGTELYDGLSVIIDGGSYTQATFDEFVQTAHQTDASNPAVSQISDISPVEVAGKTGLSYTLTGLGEFTYIYLPKETKDYLLITYIVADPTNVGFQSTVDQILSTLSY